MKRTYALMVSLALVLATPGLASADPYQRPAGNQKFIEQVISRALSQRGVPFVYGGGDSNGPTRGVVRDATVAAADPALPGAAGPVLAPTTAASPGLFPGLLGLGATPAAPVAPNVVAPNVVGFDASGLIVYSFAGVGVKLPRSSGEQYKVGQKVAPALAAPGDLIFYGPEGTQSVALFVGNGQMVETTDRGVAVSPVRTNGMAPYLVRIIA